MRSKKDSVASSVSSRNPNKPDEQKVDSRARVALEPLSEETESEEEDGSVTLPEDGDVLLPTLLTEGSMGALDEAWPISKQPPALTPLDPLTRYMNEIRRYPLLSSEEEHRLADQFAKTHDSRLAKILITANLRLVVKIAYEYRRAYHQLLDLVQEGNLGLLRAVEKYDPHRGVKLSSYAAQWIRAYMLKFILSNWRLVKIGTTQAQRKLFFNLSKEKDRLIAAGFVPTTQMLAQRLDVSEKEVSDMQMRLGTDDLSLDAPIGREEDDGRTRASVIEADAQNRPDNMMEGHEFRALLKKKLAQFEKTLKGREQTLFRDRLVAEQPLTLQEVGERYKISRERARQIEARLVARLKTYLRREMGDAVQIAMGFE